MKFSDTVVVSRVLLEFSVEDDGGGDVHVTIRAGKEGTDHQVGLQWTANE